MRLLYDAQIFNMQRYGGISRLFVELFRHFGKDKLVEWDIELDFPHNAYVQELEKRDQLVTAYSKFCWGLRFKGKGRIYNYTRAIQRFRDERQRTLLSFHNNSIDIFHPTYYDDYFLKFVGKIPFVVTVYDMVHELYPDLMKDVVTVRRKKNLVEKAQRVIAISEHTKQDLVRITGIDKNKVDVVPLSSSIAKKSGACDEGARPQRYILYVGQRSGYKNFPRFFRAVAPLMRSDKTIYLVCIGGHIIEGEFTTEEKLFIADEKLSNRVILRSATDMELENWYAGALCFVFPSLYEGFGIPILEAFSCGCPVVASNTSSLPEVGGDGAVYFDPESEDSIRDTVATITQSDEQREYLSHQGRLRAMLFSWEKTAKQTYDVYEKVLGGDNCKTIESSHRSFKRQSH